MLGHHMISSAKFGDEFFDILGKESRPVGSRGACGSRSKSTYPTDSEYDRYDTDQLMLDTNYGLLDGANGVTEDDDINSGSKTTSSNLAKEAINEAYKALSLDPKDAAAHILKALVLDLQGHKTSALKSLDSALSLPAVKSLSDRERGDALFKRAELHIDINRRRRVDSAIADLIESVKLSSENSKAYCILGECYEQKEMVDEARVAYESAKKIEPSSVLAREGLERLRP
ncbi:hypothetical protein C5167_038556 [Papaver somniferum]|uniref:Uncharacterized protein n=1 Tax=Papaver somniferum TaxID=3469 RepID=A0A4Y7IC60_PAPSO|nr:hypothetical protein C5167_038556 [Papaver somniferum]